MENISVLVKKTDSYCSNDAYDWVETKGSQSVAIIAEDTAHIPASEIPLDVDEYNLVCSALNGFRNMEHLSHIASVLGGEIRNEYLWQIASGDTPESVVADYLSAIYEVAKIENDRTEEKKCIIESVFGKTQTYTGCEFTRNVDLVMLDAIGLPDIKVRKTVDIPAMFDNAKAEKKSSSDARLSVCWELFDSICRLVDADNGLTKSDVFFLDNSKRINRWKSKTTYSISIKPIKISKNCVIAVENEYRTGKH